MAARKWKHWPNQSGDSPLAQRLDDDVDDFRGGRERTKKKPVSRLVIHMTGRTIVGSAIKEGLDPIEKCLSYYTTKLTSSHFLQGFGGELWQMTDERIRVGHVNTNDGTKFERPLYLDGSWARGAPGEKGDVISPFTVKTWKSYWPHYKSPQHLFPGFSVNDTSVGAENIPCLTGSTYLAEPLRPGLWHTAAQHVGMALLACDLADRWSWLGQWWRDPKGGPRAPTLPGHEDVDLYGRAQKSGGWDPGALRTAPRWDWPFVTNMIVLRLTVGEHLGFLRRAADVVGRTAVALF
jgi:hypothetical protein